MIARFGPAAGYSQLILGFGIGTVVGATGASLGKLDFSRIANSGLTIFLRRF